MNKLEQLHFGLSCTFAPLHITGAPYMWHLQEMVALKRKRKWTSFECPPHQNSIEKLALLIVLWIPPCLVVLLLLARSFFYWPIPSRGQIRGPDTEDPFPPVWRLVGDTSERSPRPKAFDVLVSALIQMNTLVSDPLCSTLSHLGSPFFLLFPIFFCCWLGFPSEMIVICNVEVMWIKSVTYSVGLSEFFTYEKFRAITFMRLKFKQKHVALWTQSLSNKTKRNNTRGLKHV